jgi:hypothetical protein
MREFVAVNDPFSLIGTETLKREALMFTRIAVPNLKQTFFENKKDWTELADLIRNLEWLEEKGIVFEPSLDLNAKIETTDYRSHLDSGIEYAKNIASQIVGFDINELPEARLNPKKKEALKEKLDKMLTLSIDDLRTIVESDGFRLTTLRLTSEFTRLHSIQLREIDKLDAFAILPSINDLHDIKTASKNDVVRIVLNTLPVPDDMTPWEQILDYRSDPDSQNKFLDLRNWIIDTSRSQLASNEVEDKLEYLISQYKRHMELHKIKTNVGRLESILTAAAEVVGGLASLRLEHAVKGLFSFRHHKVSLLEGELSSPGSEVAYIVKAENTFA